MARHLSALDRHDLERLIAFLRDCGLKLAEAPVPSGYLGGIVDIQSGVLVHASRPQGGETYADIIGDLLHEAGHLAVLPERLRPCIDYDVDESLDRLRLSRGAGGKTRAAEIREAIRLGAEEAATAWAYAAASHLGLPAQAAFEIAYEVRARGRADRLACKAGTHPGIALLAEAGFCRQGEWPVMSRWTPTLPQTTDSSPVQG